MVVEAQGTHRCFFDVAVNGRHAGRIVFELFGVSPRGRLSGMALCLGGGGVFTARSATIDFSLHAVLGLSGDCHLCVCFLYGCITCPGFPCCVPMVLFYMFV